MPDPARLVMCDDHAMFLDMLAEYLNNQSDLEVVHTQNNSDDLLSVLEQHNPDLLLSDLVLPGPDIYETFAKIFRRRPETRILVMSGMFNASNTTRLHNLGVHGIVSKMGTVNDILSVIRMVLAGKVHYPEAFMEKLRTDPDSVVPKISKREGEIMALIAAGLSEKKIASELAISESTVNNHKANIFSKLGVQNQVSMVVEGIRLGLIRNPILEDQQTS